MAVKYIEKKKRLGLCFKKAAAVLCSVAMTISVMTEVAAEDGTITRRMEYLDRGVAAVMTNEGVFVSWRLLVSDNDDQLFDVYRSINGGAPEKIKTTTIGEGTNCLDTAVTSSNYSSSSTYTYYVIYAGAGTSALNDSCAFTLCDGTSGNRGEADTYNISGYTIPLTAANGKTPQNGRSIRNVWVGDFDGDGRYDFALTRTGALTLNGTTDESETVSDDTTGEDVGDSSANTIGEASQVLEVYKSDGTLLWTMDYGKNSLDLNRTHPGSAVIGCGQSDGIEVYDIDCDGYAEVISQLANYVTLPDGTVWREGADDYTQYVGVFDGRTGELETYTVIPKDYYGDGAQGAFMMGIAYLDGATPSLICNWKNRGTDGKFHELILAYHMYGAELKLQWKFDRGAEKWRDAGFALDETPGGQKDGHQLRIADVDNDGRDEVLQIGFAVDDNGELLYQPTDGGRWDPATGEYGAYNGKGGNWYIGHGDRFFVCKMDKDAGVMTGYGVQQNNNANIHEYYYDASTGKVLWTRIAGNKADIGRGDAGDIDPDKPGWEFWSFYGICNPTVSGSGDAATAAIEQITGAEGAGEDAYTNDPYPSIGVWFDGDLCRENLINSYVNQWVPKHNQSERVRSLYKSRWGMVMNDRKVPLFVGDMIGDWREEIICTNGAYDRLVVYTTNIPTTERLYCLAQDPLYRNCMTIKGYVESHQVSYYLGSDMHRDRNGQPDLSKIKPSVSIIEKTAVPQKTLKVSGVKKLYYRKGKDAFDNTMTVTYTNNGVSQSIPSDQCAFTGFDNTKVGRQTVQVHYDGCMDSFDIVVADSGGIIKREDFEGSTHTGGYAEHPIINQEEEHTAVWGTETSSNNPNTSRIYGINRSNDSAWWIAPHDIGQRSRVEFDFKLDAGDNGTADTLCLLGYTKENFNSLSSDDTVGRGKQMIRITATPTYSRTFGERSIMLNGEDITDIVKPSKQTDTKRYSTGWLHMQADFDFSTRRADIALSRVTYTEGNAVYSEPIYAKTIGIGSTITEFREIFMYIGRTNSGGAYIDNIKSGIPDEYFKSDFSQSDITAAADVEYENDSSRDYPDTQGFAATITGDENSSGRIYWYLSKDGGERYTYLTCSGSVYTLDESGEINIGLIIYNKADNLLYKSISAGYKFE